MICILQLYISQVRALRLNLMLSVFKIKKKHNRNADCAKKDKKHTQKQMLPIGLQRNEKIAHLEAGGSDLTEECIKIQILLQIQKTKY